jgi:predicted DNA-binding antitoxin AbrB/MazE fold protein
MLEVVTAVYENGLLRPLTPLNLQEHQNVRLQILPEEPADEVERILYRLVEAGLMRPPTQNPPPPDPVSEERRRELADILGQAPGKPLSEIIIEERGEW